MPAFHPHLSLSVTEQAIADIAKRESIHMCEGQLNSLIHIAWQCTCTHQTNFTSSLSIYKLTNAQRPVYILTFLVA